MVRANPQAALVTRDNARTSQQKQEVALLTESKDRDRKLNENRWAVWRWQWWWRWWWWR